MPSNGQNQYIRFSPIPNLLPQPITFPWPLIYLSLFTKPPLCAPTTGAEEAAVAAVEDEAEESRKRPREVTPEDDTGSEEQRRRLGVF